MRAFYLSCALAVSTTLTACSGLPSATSGPSESELASLDYTDSTNWMRLELHPKYRVDTIYFYPTLSAGIDGEIFSDLNESKNREIAKLAFKKQGSAFEPYTNVFVPYYRSATGHHVLKAKNMDDFVAFVKSSRIKSDVYAALDQYFTKYNQGRPFILAGHSQGSAVIRLILEDYMKTHPDYLKRMVAAYAIGFPFPKGWLKKNSHVKFAQGETDIGVIVSWNTEAPGAKRRSVLAEKDGMAINPLSWKLDDSLAPVSLNKGSLDGLTGKIVDGACDARLDLQRNVVVCSKAPYRPAAGPGNSLVDFFGDKSLHNFDYELYYMNIQENGLKRIEAYLAKH